MERHYKLALRYPKWGKVCQVTGLDLSKQETQKSHAMGKEKKHELRKNVDVDGMRGWLLCSGRAMRPLEKVLTLERDVC